MKSPFCMPSRMRSHRIKNTSLSPMSLLDRFREAVFRLIMISALSRVSTSSAPYTTTSSDGQSPIRLSSRSSSKSSPAATNSRHHRSNYHRYATDSAHHTEAVADCIEFIKRSASEENDTESIAGYGGSSRSNNQVYSDKSGEIVIPLPVM